MESTLERELNVPEIVANQAIGTSLQPEMCSRCWLAFVSVVRSRAFIRYRVLQVSLAALTRVCAVSTKPCPCCLGDRVVVFTQSVHTLDFIELSIRGLNAAMRAEVAASETPAEMAYDFARLTGELYFRAVWAKMAKVGDDEMQRLFARVQRRPLPVLV